MAPIAWLRKVFQKISKYLDAFDSPTYRRGTHDIDCMLCIVMLCVKITANPALSRICLYAWHHLLDWNLCAKIQCATISVSDGRFHLLYIILEIPQGNDRSSPRGLYRSSPRGLYYCDSPQMVWIENPLIQWLYVLWKQYVMICLVLNCFLLIITVDLHNFTVRIKLVWSIFAAMGPLTKVV